jgi:hypothetical protein
VDIETCSALVDPPELNATDVRCGSALRSSRKKDFFAVAYRQGKYIKSTAYVVRIMILDLSGSFQPLQRSLVLQIAFDGIDDDQMMVLPLVKHRE